MIGGKIMEGKVYHIFARGVDKQKTFYDKTECRQFLFYLNKSIRKYNLSLFAFALRGNHFHLLIKGDDVQQAICELIKSYTGWFCHRHIGHGKVFDYPAQFVEKKLLKWQIDSLLYILNNPVAAGICGAHYCYEFCSYRFHTKRGSNLKSVIEIDTSFVTQNFKNLADLKSALQRKLAYQRLMDSKQQAWGLTNH